MGRNPHEPRPAASLTPNLLARRGDARPAMRRQPIASLHMPIAAHEDLGWNDIGDEQGSPDLPAASPVAPIFPGYVGPAPVAHTPVVRAPVVHAVEPAPETVEETAGEAPGASPITRHLDAIAQRMAQPREAAFKPMVPRRVARSPIERAVAAVVARKAAFTLRLDPERHLRLRLLSAMRHRSSQQLLIEALDALLAGDERIEDLAGQVEDAEAAVKQRRAGT